MINSNLESFNIKVFNILKLKDELKYLDYEVDLSKNQSRFNFSNGIYLGFDQKIYVYYTAEEVLNNSVYSVKKYLNYDTTLKQFENVEDAFGYIEYLLSLIKYKQLEQFFYFEYKAKKTIQLLWKKFSLKIVNNQSTDDYAVRIGISGLDFFVTICFFATYEFEVDFTPANENWSTYKIKRYFTIDDLFIDLESFTFYDLISIKESERDMF
ncbi:hypothetical protein [Flavobacterium reichenbachii]|uniref:Uncharacterized protein n=1 Tax=Flavobacterium reichenbachii TaxID=362418 RepID=A0A085ZCQ0_9FLAO|nr:hypothetical protein [Flavobacterium reichenbachii]KFF02214.1 hypothetical protein IW19_24835 [Flavobacterium reichenbachii]OXB11431.1 hypothetical protein B0A68_21035 [Flavobacterium reichenbachii]